MSSCILYGLGILHVRKSDTSIGISDLIEQRIFSESIGTPVYMHIQYTKDMTAGHAT